MNIFNKPAPLVEQETRLASSPFLQIEHICIVLDSKVFNSITQQEKKE